MLILWDISSGTSVRVLPVYEGIEGAFMILPKSLPAFIKKRKNDDIYIASAGEKGILTIQMQFNTSYKKNNKACNLKIKIC